MRAMRALMGVALTLAAMAGSAAAAPDARPPATPEREAGGLRAAIAHVLVLEATLEARDWTRARGLTAGLRERITELYLSDALPARDISDLTRLQPAFEALSTGVERRDRLAAQRACATLGQAFFSAMAGEGITVATGPRAAGGGGGGPAEAPPTAAERRRERLLDLDPDLERPNQMQRGRM